MGSSSKKSEAAFYKYNAAVLFQRAKAVKEMTKFAQMRQAEEGARVQGELEAGIGGSGTVSTQGAPLLALALQKSETNLQNYMIGYEGTMEAKELESEAMAYLMKAKQAKKGAKQSLIGGFLGAGGSLMSAFFQTPETEPGTFKQELKKSVKKPATSKSLGNVGSLKGRNITNTKSAWAGTNTGSGTYT